MEDRPVTKVDYFTGNKQMSFPKFDNEFNDWMQNGEFTMLDKEIVDHELSETGDTDKFSGIFQPMQAAKVALKPEGQRIWQWYSLISKQQLQLDDVVVFEKVKYRVFGQSPYINITGFNSYDLAEAFHSL